MTTVTKTELITMTANRLGRPQAEVKEVLDATLDMISQVTADDQKVQLKGFGTFETKHSAARTGRNPRTGEQIEIPASRRLGFKASKSKA